MSTKRCPKCGRERPRDEFFRSSRNRSGLQSHCKACFSEWRRINRPTPPRVPAIPQRLSRHGMSSDDLALLRSSQGGVCAVCGGVDVGRDLAIDHNHETGEVRGLLCGGCNLALGLMKDDPKRLALAITYLANPPARGLIDSLSCNAKESER